MLIRTVQPFLNKHQYYHGQKRKPHTFFGDYLLIKVNVCILSMNKSLIDSKILFTYNIYALHFVNKNL